MSGKMQNTGEEQQLWNYG